MSSDRKQIGTAQDEIDGLRYSATPSVLESGRPPHESSLASLFGLQFAR